MLQNTEREIQKDNPEKLATQGTQDDEKQNKSTIQYMLDITIRNQTVAQRVFYPKQELLTIGEHSDCTPGFSVGLVLLINLVFRIVLLCAVNISNKKHRYLI
jgi:hypothetical protein